METEETRQAEDLVGLYVKQDMESLACPVRVLRIGIIGD